MTKGKVCEQETEARHCFEGTKETD